MHDLRRTMRTRMFRTITTHGVAELMIGHLAKKGWMVSYGARCSLPWMKLRHAYDGLYQQLETIIRSATAFSINWRFGTVKERGSAPAFSHTLPSFKWCQSLFRVFRLIYDERVLPQVSAPNLLFFGPAEPVGGGYELLLATQRGHRRLAHTAGTPYRAGGGGGGRRGGKGGRGGGTGGAGEGGGAITS